MQIKKEVGTDRQTDRGREKKRKRGIEKGVNILNLIHTYIGEIRSDMLCQWYV